MNFKEWFLEGEYGTSAYGPIGSTFGGSTNWDSPNRNEFPGRGIRSKYQQIDLKKSKLPPTDRANAGKPVGAGVVYDDDLPTRRGVAAAAL